MKRVLTTHIHIRDKSKNVSPKEVINADETMKLKKGLKIKVLAANGGTKRSLRLTLLARLLGDGQRKNTCDLLKVRIFLQKRFFSIA